MIINEKHLLFGKVKVVDLRGNSISGAFYFNTKSKLVKFYIQTRKPDGDTSFAVSGKTLFGPKSKENKIVTASVIMKGAKLISNETGKEIK
jgi:hypothetical protein